MNNNPLKQYFRRPAVYVKLPSGGHQYSTDVLTLPETGELPVYPMTAIDEITTKTPDALYNGTAVVEVIKSCVPDIKDPWNISSIDLDAILIAIRAASDGNDMEVESECPKCKENSKYGINLIGILTNLKSPNYQNELDISDLKIKIRPLTYKELNEISIGQFEAQRFFKQINETTDMDEKSKVSEKALKFITELTMQMLTKSIEYIKIPNSIVEEKEYIYDFLKNCDKNLYIKIREYHSALKEQTELKPLHVKCVSCSHEYDQPFTLNASNFFG